MSKVGSERIALSRNEGRIAKTATATTARNQNTICSIVSNVRTPSNSYSLISRIAYLPVKKQSGWFVSL